MKWTFDIKTGELLSGPKPDSEGWYRFPLKHGDCVFTMNGEQTHYRAAPDSDVVPFLGPSKWEWYEAIGVEWRG